jgi:hypothetical protein
MIVFTILAQSMPGLLLGSIARDPETIAAGTLFLQMVSLNLVAQGLIFVCSHVSGIGQHETGAAEPGARLITYASSLAVGKAGLSH